MTKSKRQTPEQSFTEMTKKFENDPDYIIEGIRLMLGEAQARLDFLETILRKEKP
jgi:hypothetical protein